MCVLHLLDARTGSVTEIQPASRGLLRVCAHVPAGDGPASSTALRVLLVADLLTRTAEMSHLQALTAAAAAGQPSGDQPSGHQAQDEASGQAAALDSLINELGIHPPAAWTSCENAAKVLGGPVDVHLTSGSGDVDDPSGLIVRVGAAAADQADQADQAGQADRADQADRAAEPLVLRLALLSFPYHQPAMLTGSTLASARETLTGWRDGVARWAELPSKPMPASVKQAFHAAVDGLGTPSVIALLHDLMADQEMPAGARFESFMYADRVLGLDLASHIGR